MQRKWSALAVGWLVSAACGPTQSPPAEVTSVLVTPSEATVQPGGSLRFSARVEGKGSVPQEVQWSAEVDAVSGYSNGSLSADGTYRAPLNAPPQTQLLRIIATSIHSPSVSGSAQVQVPSASLTITPDNASVFLGDSLQFRATVNGTGDQTLSWWSANGTVDSNGLYTAPTVIIPGDTAQIVVRSSALNREARATIALKLRPPVLTGISGPGGPGDSLTIFGSGFLQVAASPDVVVLFPTEGADPIEVVATLREPYLDRFDVVVPIGARSGPLRVAIPVFRPLRVHSEPIAFERAPRLRLRADRVDLAAGESTRVRVAVFGSDRTPPLTFETDQGSFDGDLYVAPSTVDAISFASIRACVSGTSICSGATLAIHPFRIEPSAAVVPPGGSLAFSAVRANGSASVTFSLTGPGSLTPDGRFTAPSALIDAGPVRISATDGAHVEDAQVAAGGLVPGLVGRVADYIDQRVPDGTPNMPFGSVAETLAADGTRAYVLMRSAAVRAEVARFDRATPYWIDVYDLADPLQPAWIGAVESATRPDSMSVSHGRLYAFSDFDSSADDGRTIAVYDLSGPLPQLTRRVVAPLEVGSVSMFGKPPVLDDDFLYVFGSSRPGEQSIDVYRLSDGPLQSPREVVVPFPPLTLSISSFSARDGRAYAAFFENAPETVFARLAAWDITTSPAHLLGVTDAPVTIAFAGPPTFMGPFLLLDGCLYDRTSPVPARTTCPEAGAGIVAGNGHRFLTGSGALLELSDPAVVRSAGRIPMQGGGGVAFARGYLYAAEGTGGLGIYDASEDGGPVSHDRRLPFTQPFVFPDAEVGVAGPAGLLYAGGIALDELNLLGWAYLGIWDLQTTPASFVWQEPVASAGSPDCAPACAPSGIAVAGESLLVGRVDALEVRSLANPRSPTLLTEMAVGVSAIASRGSVAWVGTRDGNLISIDVSDPLKPAVLGQLPLAGVAKGMAMIGADLLVVAETTLDGRAGDLEVVDVSAANAPTPIAKAGLGLACAGVAIEGSIAAVATSAGLATVDLAQLSSPALLALEPLVASGFGERQYRELGAIAVSMHAGLAWVTSAGYVFGGPLPFGLGVVFAYDVRDPRHPREVMRYDTGTGAGLVFEGDRAIALGSVPSELGVAQPRNVTLRLRSPRQLQP